MTCSHCSPEETIIQFISNDNTNYVISAFATDGAAVSFSATQQDGVDIKMDSLGNILSAGSKIKKVDVTIRTPCNDAVSALYSDYKSSAFSDCGSMIVTDNCCTDEVFSTARITSMQRPAISDTVEYFEIVIMGVYQS